MCNLSPWHHPRMLQQCWACVLLPCAACCISCHAAGWEGILHGSHTMQTSAACCNIVRRHSAGRSQHPAFDRMMTWVQNRVQVSLLSLPVACAGLCLAAVLDCTDDGSFLAATLFGYLGAYVECLVMLCTTCGCRMALPPSSVQSRSRWPGTCKSTVCNAAACGWKLGCVL